MNYSLFIASHSHFSGIIASVPEKNFIRKRKVSVSDFKRRPQSNPTPLACAATEEQLPSQAQNFSKNIR